MRIKKNILFVIIALFLGTSSSNAFLDPNTFSQLAEKLSPSVVNISTTGVVESNETAWSYRLSDEFSRSQSDDLSRSGIRTIYGRFRPSYRRQSYRALAEAV